MECNTARLLLNFTRPRSGELEPGEAQALQNHLDNCPTCRTFAEAERRLDEHLGRALRDVPVPSELRTALLKRLDRERDAWYKRRLLRAAAVAAALLLVCWLGWRFYFGRLPELDLEDLRTLSSVRVEMWAEQPALAEIEDRLQQVGGRELAAPPQFHYPLLVDFGTAHVKGKVVPSLLFVRSEPGGSAYWARVYVVSDRLFNLEDLPEQRQSESGVSPRAQVLTHPKNPGVRYVVVYTGPSLEPFLGPGRQGPIAVASGEWRVASEDRGG